MLDILILGAGYVGLTTGVCFATKYSVTVVDIDRKKIAQIQKGQLPFFEEGLEALLIKAIDSKRLNVIHVDDPFPKSDLVFICVGTPADSDGYIDLKHIHNLMKTLMKRWQEVQKDYTILVLKSTAIPGTTRKYCEEFIAHGIPESHFGYAFNPEFLAQGSAVKDTFHPDRIVIGSANDKVAEKLSTFYNEFYNNSAPVLKISIESAEFTKYAANCFLAMKISFANEFANIIDTVPGADIDEVMGAIGHDHRIGPHFLRAGIGFGGSCFPKDTRAMIRFSEEKLIHPDLLTAVVKVNDERVIVIMRSLLTILGSLENRKIAVFGITFKPGTDDTRDAPSIKVIAALQRHHADIHVHDPLIQRLDFHRYADFTFTKHTEVEPCVFDADACIFLTEWPEYKALDLKVFTAAMKRKIVIDGRRIFVKGKIPNDMIYITVGSGQNVTILKSNEGYGRAFSYLYDSDDM